MKQLITLLFFLLNVLNILSQDSLKDEIENYQTTTATYITNGRQMLIDNLNSGNIEKVKSIKHYLLYDINQESHLSLYEGEIWLLCFWTKEYNQLLERLVAYNHYALTQEYQHTILPAQDDLHKKLLLKTIELNKLLEEDIRHSELKPEDKDFLVLQLRNLQAIKDNPEINQNMINDEADLFLAKYPESKYKSFIQHYVRFVISTSKWGFGFDFFSGNSWYTNDLKDKFNSNVAFGFDFDISYNQWVVYLRNYIGVTDLEKTIPMNKGDWPEGTKLNVFVPQICLGRMFDLKKTVMTPFIGYGGHSIDNTANEIDDNEALEDIKYKMRSNYSMGFNIDFKIGNSSSGIMSYNEDGYWFIRFRYALHMPQFSNRYDNTNGMMHAFTIGIGGFGRKRKRLY